MEEKIMSDKTFRIMFYLMTVALMIIALKPSKVIVLGSANDHEGDINIDVRTRKLPMKAKKGQG